MAAIPPTPRPTPTTPSTLTCPRCQQGTLISGKRGWGCSRWRDGCAFVIWFETAGKRLTPSMLTELVTKGKTRRASFRPDGLAPVEGRLVLDPRADNGAARFIAAARRASS